MFTCYHDPDLLYVASFPLSLGVTVTVPSVAIETPNVSIVDAP